ncbi:MAG: TM2 domain-containing protein [Bacteroidales bacterium]|nr:TM2 domain-containing protein [Bacteroidales bacterium]
MKPELVQAFMLKNGECFDMMTVQDVQNKLAEIDDAKAAPMISLNLQKPTLMLIIAILLGWERFFLDDIGLGVVKVITCYGCGIWWLIDIFSAQKRTYAYNYKKFCEAYMLCK